MRKATLFLSWSMLAGLCMVRAGDPTDPKEQAWKPLFDGKTMDGWQPADLYKPGPCSVKDGALCLKNGKPGENGPMTGIVSTRKDLPKKDYELRFQARRVEGDDFFATVFLCHRRLGWRNCGIVYPRRNGRLRKRYIGQFRLRERQVVHLPGAGL